MCNGKSDEYSFMMGMKQALAEYLGTGILMVFGMGSVAQFVFSEGKTGSTDQVRWSWGLGVAFGVYVSGGVSGGHLNPAVTLTLCVFKKEPWIKLIPYWLGQYLGSFTASCLVFAVYYDTFNTYQDGNRTLATAGIFATYPQEYLSILNAFGDQVFGTAVLMLLVTAISDSKNMAPTKSCQPVVVGLVVVAIGMTFSHNCGYPLNPARDLAPRIFTYLAGWGSEVFSYNNYGYFWIPVVGPHVGAVFGAGIYELCINTTLPCSVDACRCCRRRHEQSDDYGQSKRHESRGDSNLLKIYKIEVRDLQSPDAISETGFRLSTTSTNTPNMTLAQT